jgi:E3 ubiquitin ligase
MRPDQVSVLAALGAVAGPVLFAGGFRDLRLKRLIQNTPTSRIRSAAMGLVEVNGVIGCRSTVSAPFSGRACAVWNVDIAIQGRKNSWNIVHRAISGHPFFLRDETGVALVYPHDADCRVHFGVEEVCAGVALPECYASYLSTLGPRQYLWRLGMLRFRERVLEEGARVYVMGTATPPAVALTVSEGEEMAATGTDAWRASRVRGGDSQVSAVIRRGDSEKTFVISQDSERDLTTTLGLKAFARLVGGPLIGLLGIGYWLYAFASRAVSH